MLNKRNFISLGKVYLQLNKTSRSAIFAALNLWVIIIMQENITASYIKFGINKAEVYNSLAIILLRKTLFENQSGADYK